jgi:hypothetical protein
MFAGRAVLAGIVRPSINAVELNDQAAAPTLACKLGDTAHISGLAIWLARQSGAGERLPAWLLKVAIERGVNHSFSALGRCRSRS